MPDAGRAVARFVVAICCAAAALPAGTASAAAAAEPADLCTAPALGRLAADTSDAGVIRLAFAGAQGSPVVFFECDGQRARRLGDAASALGAPTILDTTWSCVRSARRFVAAATLPDGSRALGSASVDTPSCARRFTLSAPRRAKRGSTVRVRIVDRWATGNVRTRLCVAPPRGDTICRSLPIAPAVGVSGRSIELKMDGRWVVELRVRDYRVRARIAVGRREIDTAPRLPTLLAAGDSTINGIDQVLADTLGDATTVRSEVRLGTGITNLADDWPQVAERDAQQLRPETTVISIGANDDGPMLTAGGVTAVCCSEPWRAEYARRAQEMMRSFLRGGRGRVLWLTLPVPRNPRRVPIYSAVNSAILRAAGGLDGVTVLRIDELFSPQGYQDVISYRGQDVHVRAPDGIHLNESGAAIAAVAIAAALGAG